MIYYNNSSAWTKVYLGSTEFYKVYSSQAQVFPSGTPPTPSVKYAALFTGGTTSSVTCDHGTIGTLDGTDTSFGQGMAGRATTLSASVGDCVSGIGEYAFQGANRLTSVTLPNTITTIGYYAFNSCSSLSSFTIPSGVTTIGGYAFSVCSGLISIDIPDSVTSISGSAFSSCRGLTSITIGSGVTSIGDYAFAGCSAATSITINATTPPTLGGYGFRYINANAKIYVPCDSLEAYKTATNWSAYASYMEAIPNSCVSEKLRVWYYGDSKPSNSIPCDTSSTLTSGEVSTTVDGVNITAATIGDCVTTIGDAAFKYNHTNKYFAIVNIPSSVTSIGDEAFYDCDGLTSITIPSGVTSIGASAFTSCDNLPNIDIPNSVTSIGQQAFQGCNSLTSCTIGSGVTSIGANVFNACKSLTSIDIPSGVTSIGMGAFYQCSGLTSITIPSDVTSINRSAFRGCRSLTSITCLATTPPQLGSEAFLDTYNCPIYVPSGSVSAYQSATNWSAYASRIQAIPNS